VKVEAAGFGPRGRGTSMAGLPYLGRVAFGLRRPTNPVPGRDLAGTVVAVGSAVTRFAVGDAVYLRRRGGLLRRVRPSRSKTNSPAHLRISRVARPLPSPSGDDRDTGAAQRGASRAGPARSDRRCVRRRRKLRSAAGQGVRNHTSPACAARPSSIWSESLGADLVIDYTHDDFADGHRALRPDPRHRRKLVAVTAPSRAQPERDARHRRG